MVFTSRWESDPRPEVVLHLVSHPDRLCCNTLQESETFQFYQILDTRISFLPSSCFRLLVPPLDSESWWTRELWSKTILKKKKMPKMGKNSTNISFWPERQKKLWLKPSAGAAEGLRSGPNVLAFARAIPGAILRPGAWNQDTSSTALEWSWLTQ